MAIEIDTPIQFLKGVGPKLGTIFQKRGINTVAELLEWYPRAYEDRRAARSISTLEPGQVVSLKAQVHSVRSMNMGNSKRKIYEVVIGDATGKIACKYFRVPYKGYFERFERGMQIRVMGKVTDYRGRKEFHHPDLHAIQIDEEEEDRLIPIYTETEGLSFQKLKKIIDTALYELESPLLPKALDSQKYSRAPTKKNQVGKDGKVWAPVYGITDALPGWIREKYNLVSRAQALREIHQPPLAEASEFIKFRASSQKRIIFEEFFWMELNLALRRAGIDKEKSIPLIAKGELPEKLIASLPFELTGAQKKSFNEVLSDLKKPHPMHRLVQGDVGSGKTMVSFLAAAYATEAGFQTAIMVPTEILSEQHFKNAKAFLEPLGIRVALLTGSTKERERGPILEGLKAGKIDLIIGTHALIQDDVEFNALGLVIIDEQHRFGVQQRNLLKQKGLSPHFLVMTATPIPRTLAMTVYGDLDVSIIDEMPKGRQPIVTRKAFGNKSAQVFGFVKEQLAKGRQAYIVYPLVEESEKIDLKNAFDEFEKHKTFFSEYQVGLLHGKMRPAEKDEVMKKFRANEIQVLVSTTVIEVGVDVPNANIMVIEHTERFGLSQLHQLRGRVGRGAHKSYCVLMLGYATSDESRARAEIMEQTLDGFKIAEADLELRGPGEFLGTRQSGLPGFKLANLVRDLSLLQDARQAAFELVRLDGTLSRPENSQVRQVLAKKDENYIG